MTYRLGVFSDVGLDEAYLKLILDEHSTARRPRLERYWTYYRNPLRPVGHGIGGEVDRPGRWYRQAQEIGLPGRIIGRSGKTGEQVQGGRREVVIENDIAWRIQSMVDFMFSKPVAIHSGAGDRDLAGRIERALDRVWENSGGIALFQDMALLGHVYGHVDLVVRMDPEASGVESVRVEVVEPTRGIPVLDPADYRSLAAYVIHFEREEIAAESPGWLGAMAMPTRRRGGTDRSIGVRRKRTTVTEVMSSRARQVYLDERLVSQESFEWTGGRIPVCHIQNISEPFRYEGFGEVEAMIAMQDELNTRLSDRASRVTLQSFKMYLARGIEGFEKSPVGPGVMWSTDNPHASIHEFGGDGESPSELAHVQEVREALDKISCVPPLASGVVRARIGNLSSANALRITLMGLLSKTARKRVTYGQGITRACGLILAGLDHAGVLRTRPEDRAVSLRWPDPLPTDDREAAHSARAKFDLGVPRDRVLEELGYAPGDTGVT
ncbi:MAG: phage portal protein [Phycisphaeraceae bacterium]|nr:phage portal protein [Phycisphaerae bacterium]MBX3391924.1 phage portal protein [Phycisphaeraceae bacterium]HRJ48909.1 phage portal protein [Phycisphaerales bacterium]